MNAKESEKSKTTFVDGLKHEALPKTLSENGAVEYSSAGSSLVDFRYAATSLRSSSPEKIMFDYSKAYVEDPGLAVKLLFHMGDIREGMGERNIFNSGLAYLSETHPDIAIEVLPLVPEYTRWDYAVNLINCPIKKVSDTALNMVTDRLLSDLTIVKAREEAAEMEKAGNTDCPEYNHRAKVAKDNISLLAKWLPSIQVKKDAEKNRKIVFKIEKALGINHKEYRKILSRIRNNLNILEKYQSEKRMNELDLSKVSSQAMLRNIDNLRNTLGDAYNEFQEKVAAGEEKINMSVAAPHEIVAQYMNKNAAWYSDENEIKDYDIAIENAWNELCKKNTEPSRTLVIRDGSGSMFDEINNKTSVMCVDVANALSIYFSSKMEGEFKDKIITFSSHPQFVDLSGKDSLHDKLEYLRSFDEAANTDIEAVFNMVLDTAVNNKLSQDELPTSLLIVSDMEFDPDSGLLSSREKEGATYYWERFEKYDFDKTLFDKIREKYTEAGYEMPTLIFWQVNADRSIVPDIHETGTVLAAGFSVNNINDILSERLASLNPLEQLKEILSSERYDKVEEAFKAGLEKERKPKTKIKEENVK